MAKPSICLIVASEMTVTAFLMGHLRALAETYDVTVVAHTDNVDFLRQRGLDVRVMSIAIERAIRPLADVQALFSLIALFRRQRFSMIHSVTPKAGLLSMLAGLIARIPVRVHIFTGQVWATRRGLSRLLLKSMDRLLAACATHLLADSASQRKFLIAQGITTGRKLDVLAGGSISGVDTVRFHPDDEVRRQIRFDLAVGDDDVVFLFLGRLNPDKGVADLAAAFAGLCSGRGDVHLLLVGPDEAGMHSEIERCCAACGSRLHFVDYTDVPERYMVAADVFCLPSYREGFGSVIIEAAACGLPAIGSDIYGVSDAIEEGKSGLLFPCADIGRLTGCMRKMADDASLRSTMGAYAFQRARHDFSSSRVTQAWVDYYGALL